jgi:hypothetical protein
MRNPRLRAALTLTIVFLFGQVRSPSPAASPPDQRAEPAIFVPKAAKASQGPSRRWEVHLVHGSHHDLGYTDLPSNVLREQSIERQVAI